MKTLFALLVVALLSACGPICPLEAATDKSLSCDLEIGGRCVQYSRTGSLMWQTNFKNHN